MTFWGKNNKININKLLNKKYILDFFPLKSMSEDNKLNAISRLIIYISIILSFYQGSIDFLIYGIIALVIIFIWYNISNNNNYNNIVLNSKTNRNTDILEPINNYKGYTKKTKKVKKVYIKPSVNNPFMNKLPTTNIVDCQSQIDNKDVSYNQTQKEIEYNFNKSLLNDVSDIFGKSSSQRQFYTMPNTGILNDQDTFAEWLYKTPSTCKEGNGEECLKGNLNIQNGHIL